MIALEITLHSLWAKHAMVKGELFPRLESNYPIFADL
jgi:hypothetical protein